MPSPPPTTIPPTGRIVIAGGSGFLGINLARHLATLGCDIVIISRHAPTATGPWTHTTWDGKTLGPWTNHLDGATALVNLAGRTVDCIKTPANRDQILRSRVDTTLALGQALRQITTPPPVWVQMSTAHIYGDPPHTTTITDDSPYGTGLAPDVAQAWEAACAQSILPHTRCVIARTSFVLGRTGGALPRLAKLTRWGFGGKAGHGRQGISWLHQHDMNRFFTHAITDPTVTGPYLVTAPHPVSNADFMRHLRQATSTPIGLPAAAWMVNIGAPLLLRTDPELALLGRYCHPTRLQAQGFQFQYPTLKSALEDLYPK